MGLRGGWGRGGGAHDDDEWEEQGADDERADAEGRSVAQPAGDEGLYTVHGPDVTPVWSGFPEAPGEQAIRRSGDQAIRQAGDRRE